MFRILLHHFGLLECLNWQAKKKVIVLVGLIDDNYHEEIGLILKFGGGRGVCLENLLILQCRIKVNRETNIGRLIIGRSFRNEVLYTFLRQKEISGHHQLKMSLVRQGGTMAVQISLL